MSNQATPEQNAARTTAQQLAEAWYAVAVSNFSKLSNAGGKVFDGLADAFNGALEAGWPELDRNARWEVRKLVATLGAKEVLSIDGNPTKIEGPDDHFCSYGVRNYVAYVKYEIVNSARSDFMDALADALANVIQAGATEDQIRSDFEAQLSLQNFDK